MIGRPIAVPTNTQQVNKNIMIVFLVLVLRHLFRCLKDTIKIIVCQGFLSGISSIFDIFSYNGTRPEATALLNSIRLVSAALAVRGLVTTSLRVLVLEITTHPATL